MRIEKIKKKQILLYLPFLIIPKVQKEPTKLRRALFFFYRGCSDGGSLVFRRFEQLPFISAS